MRSRQDSLSATWTVETTGWRSRGYNDDPYLAAQETRVRRFHEVLNDYMAGSPPGR